MTTTLFKPRRAFAHPLWAAALAILIANDHYLKTAGILPGWLTGKLSDFAGLLVAPAVLAAVLFVSTRRGVLLAHAAIGAVFAAIKIAPPAARAFEALTTLTPFPWRIVVDPTDLIALPMLVVSYAVLAPVMRGSKPTERSGRFSFGQTSAVRPIAERALLMVGSIACMATTPEPGPCPNGNCMGGVAPSESGALVLGNATDEDKLVRLRRLKASVTVDCDALMADPSSALSRELFEPAEAWLLQPTRALVLANGKGCAAFLVDADGLDMTLLAWRDSDFDTQPVSTVLGGTGNTTIDGKSREVIMRVDASVGRIELDPHPAIFEAPPLEDPAPGAGCDTPGDEAGIEWSTPIPLGLHEISAITIAPDGCASIDFTDAPKFYLCVPEGTFPFQVGDSVDVSTWEAPADGSFPEALGEAVDVSGLSLVSATSAMIVARGNVIARWDSPDFKDYSVEADPATGCAGSHDACGSLVVPLEVSLFGGTAPEITILKAGKQVTLAQGAGSLHLVRAQAMPIQDSQCAASGAPTRLFESILVRMN